MGCDLRIAKFSPLKVGHWKSLPEIIQRKKATVNIKSKGNFCFKWAVLACLHKTANSNRSCSYKQFEHLYDFDCVSHPTSLSEIPTFEKQNNLAVNVFKYNEENGLTPAQISKFNYSDKPTVNLLLLVNTHTSDCHFVAIRNLHRLLGKNNCHRKLLCYNCLQRIPLCSTACSTSSQRACKLNFHREKCENFVHQKVKMPQLESGFAPCISFENYSNQMKSGYVLYADIESLLKRLRVCKPNRLSYTMKRKRHILTGFSYALVKENGELVSHKVYRGKDAMTVFLRDCLKISETVMEIYDTCVPNQMTAADLREFKDAEICHICKKPFDEDDVKCKDHNHLTGDENIKHK